MNGMVRCLFAALLLLAGRLGIAAELDHDGALSALRSPDAQVRFVGVERLGAIGSMQDVDSLFQSLRDDQEAVRGRAEASIWEIWSRSGDLAVDRLFQRGVREMNERNLARAISTFSEIIKAKPDFAEGWNKRATLYFMARQYEKSLADCDEVLKRNPNHFGALAGYGQIYLELDQPERALEYFQRALNVNPNLITVGNIMYRVERALKAKRAKSI